VIIIARKRADEENHKRFARPVEEVTYQRQVLLKDTDTVILAAKRRDDLCCEFTVLPDVEGGEVSGIIDKNRGNQIIRCCNEQNSSNR